MTIALWIVAVTLIVVGVIGTVLPARPLHPLGTTPSHPEQNRETGLRR
jgi:hypothetical protein